MRDRTEKAVILFFVARLRNNNKSEPIREIPLPLAMDRMIKDGKVVPFLFTQNIIRWSLKHFCKLFLNSFD